jgi:nucleoside-diphosphate-sugar epimerase
MHIFVAGATGATGLVFVREAARRSPAPELRLHVRTASAATSHVASDARARVFEGCDAIVSFVGTMRNRFKSGDTYESCDVGSTRNLVAGAIAANVPRFLLMSSLGASAHRKRISSYLAMKFECERIALESPLRVFVFRPSALVTPEGAPGLNAIFKALKSVPGLTAWADDVRPIPLDVVARAFLAVAMRDFGDSQAIDHARGSVLEGRDIWRLGGDAAC